MVQNKLEFIKIQKTLKLISMPTNIVYIFKSLICLLMLTICINSIQLTLIHQTTCIEYEVQKPGSVVLFSYHFNPQIDEVNMILYDKNAQQLHETGSDINYDHYFQIQLQQQGLYPICFEKNSKPVARIQFDILNEQQQMITAGKEDINKLSKKISEFLIDIKKTAWEFKQILQQQNDMKEILKQNQNNNYYIFMAKLVVMLIILGIQFYAVKFYFN